MGAVADRRLTLSERLGEGIENRLRHRREPEQNRQRVRRDDRDPSWAKCLEALTEPGRNKQRPLLPSRHDDPPTGRPAVATAGVCVRADENEALLDQDESRIVSSARAPHLAPRQRDPCRLPGHRSFIAAELCQHTGGRGRALRFWASNRARDSAFRVPHHLDPLVPREGRRSRAPSARSRFASSPAEPSSSVPPDATNRTAP